MMFSACIWFDRLTFAIAGLIYHFQNNSNTLLCQVAGNSAKAMRSAYVGSLTQWGLSALSASPITGRAIAYFVLCVPV